ncbi:unnamed protein product, partial [Pleuronectes platessa]
MAGSSEYERRTGEEGKHGAAVLPGLGLRHHRLDDRGVANHGEEEFGLHKKLKQKALKQPKQKKSKSAEFLMGEEERHAVVGIENPAFNGGGSAEPSVPLVWLGREIRGDRPDSTLAAHPKKMELQAPAKEREKFKASVYQDSSSKPREEGGDQELKTIAEVISAGVGW